MTFEYKIMNVSFKFKNMKKIILSIIAATFMVNLSSAQEEPVDLRKNLTFGLKAGVNLSNVYDATGEEFDNEAKFGLAAGAFVAIPLGTYIGIQPEVLFSQKGFKATGSVLGSDYEFKRNTNYLDVPIFLALKPSPIVTLLAGPQFSFLLDGKYDFENEIISGELGDEFENDDVRNNTLCLTGGIDLTLDNLVISGRAGWDLKENNEKGESTTPRYKNVWLQATIGFRF